MKLTFAVILLMFYSTGVFAEPIARTKTRSIMVDFLKSIEKVLPLSLEGDAFENPKNRALISKELKALAAKSKDLSGHFKAKRSGEYTYLANSIARDAREVNQLFEKKSYEQARFIIHHISENCVSCHSKEPSSGKFPGPAKMFDRLNASQLNGFDLAHFKVMSRQFDDSLTIYEKEFLKKTSFNSKAFVDYLKVALRVNMDAKRVTKLLEKLAVKKDYTSSQRKTLASWLKQIKHIDKSQTLKKPSLANARQLILAAKEEPKSMAVYGKEKLIFQVAASSILHRELNKPKNSSARKSEIYFLLAQTEESLSDSLWISEIENYLEQSVRIAPKEKWAPQAYALLEDQYVLGYSGSSGTNLPSEVVVLLKELRVLIGLSDKKSSMN